MSRWKMVKKIIKAIFTKPLTIIKGTYYNVTNKHEDLVTKRLKICYACKYAENVPITHGRQNICTLCGCVLESKTRIQDEQCEMNKW